MTSDANLFAQRYRLERGHDWVYAEETTIISVARSRPYESFLVNIVILHCHFERGGVSQVVENHVRALKNTRDIQQIFLASGGRTGGLSTETLAAVTTLSIDDFDYDMHVARAETIANRAASIKESLTRALYDQGLDRESTILHWHNHSLGKNSAAPAVIGFLAQAGWRLLLQIHDFAEDNRPGNYRQLISACSATDKADVDRYLYPLAAQIHYATLTQADQSALRQIGIPPERANWLPNSVAAPSKIRRSKKESLVKIRREMKLPDDARWTLYPVRGIRRKNVGEFLLLSRWTKPDCYSGITLRPATPIEERSYDRWCEIAINVAPRALFDAASHDSIQLADNLAAADRVLSTSVAEGFGMTYLEPWLSGREVIARRLHSVTDDFKESGIQLTKLYDQISIPGSASWIEESRCQYQSAFQTAWNEIPNKFRPSIFQASVESSSIDFAMLTPERQIETLSRMSRDAGFDNECQQLSASLVRDLISDADDQIIQQNASIVRDRYSIEQAGQSLKTVYGRLMESPIDLEIQAPLNAGVGLDTINAVRRFYPCRTEVL